MRIVVDSNIKIVGKFEPPCAVEIDSPRITLGDLLRRVQEMVPSISVIMKGSGRWGEDLRKIILNGREVYMSDENLNFLLEDGSSVYLEFYLGPLGGGEDEVGREKC